MHLYHRLINFTLTLFITMFYTMQIYGLNPKTGKAKVNFMTGVTMRIFFLALCLSFSTAAQAGDRLEGISGSLNEAGSLFFGWFSDDKKQEEKMLEQEKLELEAKQQAVKLANDLPNEYYDEDVGCLKQKSYILDVENPQQYKRIEDYPFTYECVAPR